MADNLNSSSRVPNGSGASLPNVGQREKITPSLFNKLAEGIDRATMQFGTGIRVTKTASSTIVSAPKQFFSNAPFRALRVGAEGESFLTFRLGQVISHRFNNYWRDNNTLVWAGNVQYNIADDQQEGYHAVGTEIMFDVPGTNYLSSQHILRDEILQLPFKEGLYLLEFAQWSGLQLEPAAGTTPERAALVAGWNTYSTKMKGIVKPIIKYAAKDKMIPIGKKRGVIPLCTVDKYGRIFQCVLSDIFLGGDWAMKPFTVTLTKQGTEAAFMVYPGTVNRIVPKMSGEYLDALESPTIDPVYEEGYVAIKCTYVPETFFPRMAEVVYLPGITMEPYVDTEEESYFPVAKINKDTSGDAPRWSVVQLSDSNMVVNRLKSGANTAVWWWDEMG